jgi:hypothetical protein
MAKHDTKCKIFLELGHVKERTFSPNSVFKQLVLDERYPNKNHPSKFANV